MSTENTDSNAASFPQFTLLPLELRRKIFAHALPIFERVIEVEPIYYAVAASDIYEGGCTALQYIRIRASSGPTLLHVNHETRVELIKHYSCPFSSEIGDVSSLMINWHVDKLFVNTKSQVLWTEFEPWLHWEMTTHANLLKPLSYIFSPEGYVDMQKNMKCIAGNCRAWNDCKRANPTTGVLAPIFTGFAALEKVFIVHAAKDDVPAPRCKYLPKDSVPARAVSKRPSLSTEGWTQSRVYHKEKRVVDFQNAEDDLDVETRSWWSQWSSDIPFATPNVRCVHVVTV